MQRYRRLWTAAVLHLAIAVLISAHNIKQCTSRIYCNGPLLDIVQKSGLFADSKTFVDMPTKHSEEQVLAAFARLGDNPRLRQVRRFVEDNFLPAGTELEAVDPSDWRPSPAFLSDIRSNDLRLFASNLHDKWRGLVRRTNRSKTCSKCVVSSLNLRHPFVIPGGRFREFYYWDTFWVLEGLIVSGMCETARGIMENMYAMIDEFGFVPNGSRVYYLTRSHPPLLVDMVERYVEGCGVGDKADYFKRIMPFLEYEYEFWMEHRSVRLSSGASLNVYRADQREARPESYREDTSISTMLHKRVSEFYQNVASGAESGWDFSGRWFADGQTMAQIRTSQVVPVDLNSVLYSNEIKLAGFYSQHLRDELKAGKMRQAAERRKKTMLKFMLDGDQWKDYDVQRGEKRHIATYISSLSPLLFHLQQGDIPDAFHNLLTKYPGGAVISEANTGQQWDFPNVWAPYQYRLIKYWLERRERAKAIELAQRFVTSCYCGYQKYGYVFEKYHGERVGEPGGGGEYVVQEGFGWTNGVLLWLFKQFPAELTAPIACVRYESSLKADSPPRHIHPNRLVAALLFVCILLTGVLVFLTRLRNR